MNRICRAFDDIGNINMNWAGIAPFNHQMLMSEPCDHMRTDIVNEFCALDNIRVSLAISNAEDSPAENEIIDNSSIIDEHIIYSLTNKFGSIEICYPHIVEYLFGEDGVNKASHKQTFWRIFGDIAIRNLENNLKEGGHTTCHACGAKVPVWAKTHDCPKNTQGFFTCVECGKSCIRTNSKQKRCPECQEHHRYDLRHNNRSQKGKEREKQFITFLQYRYKKTL